MTIITREFKWEHTKHVVTTKLVKIWIRHFGIHQVTRFWLFDVDLHMHKHLRMRPFRLDLANRKYGEVSYWHPYLLCQIDTLESVWGHHVYPIAKFDDWKTASYLIKVWYSKKSHNTLPVRYRRIFKWKSHDVLACCSVTAGRITEYMTACFSPFIYICSYMHTTTQDTPFLSFDVFLHYPKAAYLSFGWYAFSNLFISKPLFIL